MENNIAIIGLGSIGARYLRLLRKFGFNTNIIVVRSGNGIPRMEEDYADKIVYSIKDAIELGIDTAIIATPATLHVDQAIDLISSNIHVLIEKPLSNSLINCDKLIKLQQQIDVVVLLGYCLRYLPAAKKFKELILNKKVGDILEVHIQCKSYLPDWRPNQNYKKSVSARQELGGGVLLELSHELDYLIWFFGEIQSVKAKLHWSGNFGNIEDTADLMIQTKNDTNISVSLDFNSKVLKRNCIVTCSEGNLVWDILHNKISIEYHDKSIDEKHYNEDYNFMYVKQLEHFFDCVENHNEPKIKITDGINVLKIIEAAKISNSNNEKVNIS